MQLFRKVVVSVLAVSLVGNTLLWAETPEQIPLTVVQEQAKQDAAQMSNLFTGKAPYIVLVGLLATSSVALAYNTKALRSEVSALERSLEWEKKSNQLHYNEATRYKTAYNGLQTDYQKLEQRYKGLLDASRKSAQAASEQLTQVRSETEALKNTFIQQINELKQSLQAAHYLINENEHLLIIQKEMERFNPLFDPNLPKVQREALLKEFKESVWFTSMSRETRRQFNAFFQSLSFYQRDSNAYFLTSTKEALDIFMTQQTTSAGERMLALVRNLLAKKNILFSGIIFFAAISVSATNTDKEAQQMAERIYQNVNLFLQATPEQLALLESNPITYKACLDNAAALHELAQLDPQVLQEMQRAHSPTPLAVSLRSVHAR